MRLGAVLCASFVVAAAAVLLATLRQAPPDGVDQRRNAAAAWLEGPCTLEERRADQLTRAEFVERYRNRLPVVIRGGSPASPEFVERTAPLNLLAAYGNTSVMLSSANAISHSKLVVTFAEYYRELMKPATLEEGAADQVWYKFGDHEGERAAWGPLLALYDPHRMPWVLETDDAALSFGVANTGSGVPFHVHGAVFASVEHGAKRWFLYPPEERRVVQFDGNTTTFAWLHATYARMDPAERPLECVCYEGDLIYIPSAWHHATLNIGKEPTVFMSAFINNPYDVS